MNIPLLHVGLAAVLFLAGGAAQSRPESQPAAETPESAPAKVLDCRKCHAPIVTGAYVHKPTAAAECSACHKQTVPGEHEFADLVTDASLCTSCHKLELRAQLHKPVAEGKCLACHDPHRGGNRHLLRPSGGRKLCEQCHKDKPAAGKFNHGPFAAGGCSVCHAGHSSDFPHLTKKPGATGCLDCHAEYRAKLAAPAKVHKPVAEDCSRCHDPHASDHPFQLKESPATVCVKCHEGVGKALEGAKVVHGPLKQEGSCHNCHDPHASPAPKLLARSTVEVCQQCHAKEITRADGSVVADVFKKMAESKMRHGPLKNGDCAACHTAHASSQSHLLSKGFPGGFYAKWESGRYELCFSCHDEEAVTSETTEDATQFRDGSRNLHWIHVRGNKGRSCVACHEVHAANVRHYLAEKVRFGQWEMPLNFAPTPEGGSCAPGCHDQKAYARNRPASAPAPQSQPAAPAAPAAQSQPAEPRSGAGGK